MENQLKQLPLIRICLLLTIPLCVFLAMRAPEQPAPKPVFFMSIVCVAAAEAVVAFFLRARLLTTAKNEWQEQSASKAALQRWLSANIVPWALCLSIAMYGMILRYVGYSLKSVAPFFIAGFVLILCCPPRRPEQAP